MLDPTDEKYTARYIEREANLILFYVKNGRRIVFGSLGLRLTERDRHILQSWGLM